MGNRHYVRMSGGDEALVDLGGIGVIIKALSEGNETPLIGVTRVQVKYNAKKEPCRIVGAPVGIFVATPEGLAHIPLALTLSIPTVLTSEPKPTATTGTPSPVSEPPPSPA